METENTFQNNYEERQQYLSDNGMRNIWGETARWGKFVSIVGFIFSGFMLLSTLAIPSALKTLQEAGDPRLSQELAGVSTGFMMFFMILGIALLLVPSIFLWRFSTNMLMALGTDNYELIKSSFGNLRRMIKFVGILTAVLVALWVLAFVGTLIGSAIGGSF